MTKYVALRERNQPQSCFPHLRESLEPLDCLNIRVPGLYKRLYVRSANRITSIRNPILIKFYEKIIMIIRQTGPTKLPKLITPLQDT